MKQLTSARWFRQTLAERASYRDTINLFFGALLGANLGTLSGLGLEAYVHIVILLTAVVMALRVLTAARSRLYALVTLLFYGAALGAGYLSGTLQPDGLADADFARLAATIAIWLGAIAVIEFTPTAAE